MSNNSEPSKWKINEGCCVHKTIPGTLAENEIDGMSEMKIEHDCTKL